MFLFLRAPSHVGHPCYGKLTALVIESFASLVVKNIVPNQWPMRWKALLCALWREATVGLTPRVYSLSSGNWLRPAWAGRVERGCCERTHPPPVDRFDSMDYGMLLLSSRNGVVINNRSDGHCYPGHKFPGRISSGDASIPITNNGLNADATRKNIDRPKYGPCGLTYIIKYYLLPLLSMLPNLETQQALLLTRSTSTIRSIICVFRISALCCSPQQETIVTVPFLIIPTVKYGTTVWATGFYPTPN